MKAEIATKWVGALRGGHYKQTDGTLKDSNGGYCCLGVLTNIYAKETGKKWKKSTTNSGEFDFNFNGETVSLPREVMKWAGLKSEDPVVAGHSLSDWNDAQGASFKYIADILEKKYLGTKSSVKVVASPVQVKDITKVTA